MTKERNDKYKNIYKQFKKEYFMYSWSHLFVYIVLFRSSGAKTSRYLQVISKPWTCRHWHSKERCDQYTKSIHVETLSTWFNLILLTVRGYLHRPYPLINLILFNHMHCFYFWKNRFSCRHRFQPYYPNILFYLIRCLQTLFSSIL